jgi:hypothetical protein
MRYQTDYRVGIDVLRKARIDARRRSGSGKFSGTPKTNQRNNCYLYEIYGFYVLEVDIHNGQINIL